MLNRLLVYILLMLFLAGCAKNSGPAAFRRGMRALEKGRYAESIAWLQRSLPHITANDERAYALNGIGISYYRLGQEKNAIQAFETAIAADPGAIEPFYNLGIVTFETGNKDKAIACFEKAALLNENDTRSLEFLAAIYSRHQQWDDARRVLNEAARHSSNSPRIITALALMELKANNTNQALELLQQALEQNAHYAPAIYNLAAINQQWLQKRDQALPLFNEYVRLVRSGPQANQARAMIKEIKQSSAQQSAASNATGLSRTSGAIKETTIPVKTAAPAAETQQPANARAVTMPSFEELMQVAKKLEQQGRREAAFNNYLRIAHAAEQADKTAIKNQALRHAVSLAEGNPQAACDLGIYFMERNRNDEAFLYLKTAMDKDVSQPSACLALAKVALDKGEYDTAIVSLKKADQIKPDDPEALWLLAELYDHHLFLTNSAAIAYNQFAQRFPNDRRTSDASNRLKVLKPDTQLPKSVSTDGKKSRSLLQRIFKPSAGGNK